MSKLILFLSLVVGLSAQTSYKSARYPTKTVQVGGGGGGGGSVTVESSTKSSVVVANSLTFSHTCTAATLLFVKIATDSNNTVTSCTYNGVAMTRIWTKNGGAGVTHTEGWMLVNPATGANNVVANFTTDTAQACAIGFLGTVTTSVSAAHRTVYTASDGGSGPTVTVTDSVAGDMVVCGASTYNATITVGGTNTVQQSQNAFGGGNVSWGVSTQVATGANTVMSWAGGTFNCSGAVALIAQ